MLDDSFQCPVKGESALYDKEDMFWQDWDLLLINLTAEQGLWADENPIPPWEWRKRERGQRRRKGQTSK